MSRRRATSAKILRSIRSAPRRWATMAAIVSPPDPNMRPMVMTGMSLLSPPPLGFPLLQVIAELLRPRWMAQLAERLGLDLPDALPRHPEPLPHLLQRPLVSVDQPEAQLQHTAFAGGEGVEDVLYLVVEQRQRRRVGGGDRLFVLDEVAEVGVL